MRYASRFVTVLVLLVVCAVAPVWAQGAPAANPEEPEDFVQGLRGLNQLLGSSLSSNQVLGQPVQVGEVTFIPVVIKALGFGIGQNLGAQEQLGRGKEGEHEKNESKGRIGLGGGGMVRPVAILMVHKDGTFRLINLRQNFLAEVVKQIIPMVTKAMNHKFSLQKMKMGHGAPHEPQPPK
jgi:uncharacterized spore protein YtfJ